MKVLFAVSSESISDAIVKKYQKESKEIISHKNVYYFNAILKEIQKDKSYDRIVISEDLESFSNNNYDAIDKFIFEKLDDISDEAQDIDGNETSIILICSDRHAKGSSFLVKLFSLGIYNALLGEDRSISNVCELINKPRTKKEAKIYYKIDSDEVNYDNKNSEEVSEIEIRSILDYFKKLGKNTDKYADAFNNITTQYTEDQLKIIINCLPTNVKAVLEDDCKKYQELMSVDGMVQRVNRESEKNKAARKDAGIKIDIIESKKNGPKMSGQIIIPGAVRTSKQQGPAPVRPMGNNIEVLGDKREPTKNKKIVKKSELASNRNEQETIHTNKIVSKTPEARPVKKVPTEVKPIKNVTTEKTATVRTEMRKEQISPVSQVKKVRPTSEVSQIPPVAGNIKIKKESINSRDEEEKKGRGRPRKNPVQETNKKPSLLEEEDDFMLPGMDDTFEVNEDMLPGMDDSFEIDEDVLPGMDDDFESDEEDLLPGMDDEFEEDEDDSLPGMDDEFEEDEDDLLPGMNDDFEEDEDDSLPGMDDEFEEDEDDSLPGMDDEFEEDEEDLLPEMDDEFEEDEEDLLPEMDDDFEDDDTLPGMMDDFDEVEEETLPNFDEDEEEYTAEVALPGIDELDDFEDENSSVENKEDDIDDILPGMDDAFESDEEDDLLAGFEDDDEMSSNANNSYNQQNNEIESIKPKVDYSMSSLNSLLTKDKKIVTFLGTSKNGTSFLVNNLAALFSLSGINTAILDMTKNKNSYYIYTNNEEELRNIAYNSISKLQSGGYAEGIKVNKNLSVYTALPNDGKDYSNAEPILSTLVQNHSLILIDCDFDTDPSYFASCQEIYLVQSMDILTIQPLTARLRDLKTKGVLDDEKVRVVINKELKVKSLTTKAIIGGMSFYNDPSMSFMTELFNKDMVKACSIPFDENAYSKYLDGMVNCNIPINAYSKQFMSKLRNLGDMVYPLVSKSNYGGKTTSQVNQINYGKNKFSNNMNNTLNQMKKKY